MKRSRHTSLFPAFLCPEATFGNSCFQAFRVFAYCSSSNIYYIKEGSPEVEVGIIVSTLRCNAPKIGNMMKYKQKNK